MLVVQLRLRLWWHPSSQTPARADDARHPRARSQSYEAVCARSQMTRFVLHQQLPPKAGGLADVVCRAEVRCLPAGLQSVDECGRRKADPRRAARNRDKKAATDVFRALPAKRY